MKWKNCLIAMIDVIGVKSLAQGRKGEASKKMRTLHKIAAAAMTRNDSMSSVAHAYAWNDSVLLLAYLENHPTSASDALLQISHFKQRVDGEVGRSYAICVKGQSFPEISPSQISDQSVEGAQSRCTVLATSSYAMANCFLIEQALKKHKAAWYIDSRLAKSVGRPPWAADQVTLQPRGRPRRILMFKDYLHAPE